MKKLLLISVLFGLYSLSAQAASIACGASINPNMYEDNKVESVPFNLSVPSNEAENDKMKNDRIKGIGSIDGTNVSVEVYAYEANGQTQQNIQLNEGIPGGSTILSSSILKKNGLTHVTYRALGSNSVVQFWCDR